MTAGLMRPLRDVRSTDAREFGGKAASLGELIATGARVPEGFVLAPAATALAADDRLLLLLDAAGRLGNGPYAVRSSGIREDGEEHSFAGIYESVLNVPAQRLAEAYDRVVASATSGRAAEYDPASTGRMAVIVQRMVAPVAAGVALTADPITGDRQTCVVTAVRGLAERLVAGQTPGDEWCVRGRIAESRRRAEGALDGNRARAVAREAARIAGLRGAPQDIEWAIDGSGELWIVQSRPMTALPPETTWEPPAPGSFSRTLRFGEWISEPVTPLFESWLLTTMEERFHARLLEEIGQLAPRPFHVVVNGWYFYSLNWASPGAFLRNAPRMLARALRSPRTLAGILPATIRHAVPSAERHWREHVQPGHRSAVARAQARVETVPAWELPALVDELASLAGEYFLWIAVLTGATYKTELNLAGFHRRHLRDALGWSHLPLVSGFEATADPSAPAVSSLDWWFEPAKLGADAAAPARAHAAVVEARQAAEAAARAALASSPKRLWTFERLLADAQHLLAIRDEQTRELTIAWPVLRRAVLRIGGALAGQGTIVAADDVFFLTRSEVLEALLALQAHDARGEPGSIARIDVAARRTRREEQARLVPPLVVGRLPRMAESMWKRFASQAGAVRSDGALVSGSPASAGRATGVVRVVRGSADFASLQAGEILVAPITAPAWTPLFARAAALVTDVGSVASHAALVAREYGIPAVVGTGDGTARLRTGMRVTVDGSTGNVEAA